MRDRKRAHHSDWQHVFHLTGSLVEQDEWPSQIGMSQKFTTTARRGVVVGGGGGVCELGGGGGGA